MPTNELSEKCKVILKENPCEPSDRRTMAACKAKDYRITKNMEFGPSMKEGWKYVRDVCHLPAKK